VTVDRRARPLGQAARRLVTALASLAVAAGGPWAVGAALSGPLDRGAAVVAAISGDRPTALGDAAATSRPGTCVAAASTGVPAAVAGPTGIDQPAVATIGTGRVGPSSVSVAGPGHDLADDAVPAAAPHLPAAPPATSVGIRPDIHVTLGDVPRSPSAPRAPPHRSA
jgi:hypothetical protein